MSYLVESTFDYTTGHRYSSDTCSLARIALTKSGDALSFLGSPQTSTSTMALASTKPSFGRIPINLRKTTVACLVFFVTAYVVLLSSETQDLEGFSIRRRGVRPVDCSKVAEVEPVNLVTAPSKNSPNYTVSQSYWSVGKKNRDGYAFGADGSVRRIHELLSQTDGALIDVGANLGFMTMNAYTQGREVYAIEPISYNIAKLCEGKRGNTKQFKRLRPNRLKIFHAAAGAKDIPQVEVSRPSDKIGKFDQSSLSPEYILRHKDLVVEMIPLVTLDSIIPESTAIGLVKIDVQGHEESVIKGMTKMLQQRRPKFVFYEYANLGQKLDTVQPILEGHGYVCSKEETKDILCERK